MESVLAPEVRVRHVSNCTCGWVNLGHTVARQTAQFNSATGKRATCGFVVCEHIHRNLSGHLSVGRIIPRKRRYGAISHVDIQTGHCGADTVCIGHGIGKAFHTLEITLRGVG